jgi:hypothetical protein
MSDGGDIRAVTTEANGEISCSVEEWNKIRAKLGLKPLKEGPSSEKLAEENMRKAREDVSRCLCVVPVRAACQLRGLRCPCCSAIVSPPVLFLWGLIYLSLLLFLLLLLLSPPLPLPLSRWSEQATRARDREELAARIDRSKRQRELNATLGGRTLIDELDQTGESSMSAAEWVKCVHCPLLFASARATLCAPPRTTP